MRKHLRTHQSIPARRLGRPRKTADSLKPGRSIDQTLWEKVHCQRFFVSGPQSRFFQVAPPLEPASNQVDLICAQVYEQIRQYEEKETQYNQIITTDRDYSEYSPWLEKTRWRDYLHGYTFTELAALAYMPDPIQEPILQLWMGSLDTVLDQALQSIADHRINMFDQARINSFVDDAYRRPSHRPVFYHLTLYTNQRYRRIWKRLLCFVHRTAQPSQSIRLAHILTKDQVDLLQQMEEVSQQLYRLTTSAAAATRITHIPRPLLEDAIRDASVALNRICLLFCIALLDHVLRRDTFESVVIGFFAILGIEEKKERAVLAVDDGTVDEPSSILDEMRQRFLIYGCATLVGWALRLRTYGKKIKVRQTPILPGHVDWSDDNSTLTYRGQSLHMVDFQRFVHDQVQKLQSQLNHLLLQTMSSSPPIIPKLNLSDIHDDHANRARGWNLLRDPRNQTQLAGYEQWALGHIIYHPPLRQRFIETNEGTDRVFLERLLLVCHLTSGHPARGTEILSLRHVNTVHGDYRGVFVENGLVGLVTAYHKGYHMIGSTSLIHRYLPERASEILIYYLWLVHPFQRQLRTLAFQDIAPMSPFLWPEASGFTSVRLSKALRRGFQECLHIDITLADYRHVANAISRRHLRMRGFQREYEIPVHPADLQASHTT
ncbi:hypothetical protein N7510_011820 [Penicillium lagena]|uniref:uncharacterized protein n=1 Tax=Penicillium lagena TaxID=94218 RepID=UPI002541BEAC|nr:uncharacterized protein N7510_011820 [Penicillium lagena]KAJ5602286.1 hypothetical protein N7510_011820 [Penicillium lagena]